MPVKLVVFDIAGTTVMDNGNINKAFIAALSNAGYKANAADVDKVMGYRKTDAIKTILANYHRVSPDANPHLVNIIHNDFVRKMIHFYEHDELKAMPFAEDIFQQLQNAGIKIALNTGFSRVITDTILNRLGWDKSMLINCVISSDEVPEGRPHPFMIRKIMQQLKIEHPNKVAKVGDTKVDIQEGRNAGCGLVVAVATGAYTKEKLLTYTPDHVIDSLQQLPALIC